MEIALGKKWEIGRSQNSGVVAISLLQDTAEMERVWGLIKQSSQKNEFEMIQKEGENKQLNKKVIKRVDQSEAVKLESHKIKKKIKKTKQVSWLTTKPFNYSKELNHQTSN